MEQLSQSTQSTPTNQTAQSYQPVQQKKKNPLKTIASVFGGIFAFFVVMAMFSGGETSTPSSSSNSGNSGNSVSQNNSTEETISQPEKSPEEIEIEYKSACSTYDYQAIFRDSEKFKGEKATFTGEATQVLVEGTEVNIRMSVTKSDLFGTDYYEDVVFVIYEMSEGESRILNNDIITVYGELNGVLTYESIMGENISVPRLDVKYIDNITAGDVPYTTEEIPDDTTEEVHESYQGEIVPTSQVLESSINEIDYYINVIDSYGVPLFLEYSREHYEMEDLNYLMYYFSYDDAGCAMIDIDGNGIKELFIGIQNDGGNFMDLYTIHDEQVKLVARNEELGSYTFCDDGLFYYLSANETDNLRNGIYHLYNSSLVEATFVPLNEWEFKEGNIPYEPLDNYLFRP